MMEPSARWPARFWVIGGAANGFVAVVMGAFAAHGLRKSLAPEALDWIRTGASYQMWHALALLGVAVLCRSGQSVALQTAGASFFAGTALFSGSLYLLAITGWHGFAWITPLGGAAFLLGWALLAWHGVTRMRAG
jgi:uncharacterized membrane protein YgdD (TMEM256/DUF423 family)